MKLLKQILYFMSIILPIIDIVKGAIKGITEELEKIGGGKS